MALSRRSPSQELYSLHDAIDRMFDAAFSRSPWPESRGGVPLDIAEEDGNLIVKASLPGVKPEEISVEVQDDVLTISGESKEDKERKEEDYHLREHRYGRFQRAVRLPCPVVAERAKAEYEAGVLRLTLPKAEAAQGKRIEVKAHYSELHKD